MRIQKEYSHVAIRTDSPKEFLEILENGVNKYYEKQRGF